MAEHKELDEQLMRYLLGEMDEGERREVEAWIARGEDNERYFKQFQQLHLRVEWGMRAKLVNTSFGILRQRLTRRRRLRLWRGVAAAVALLCVGGWLWWERGIGQQAVVDSLAETVAIQPGRSVAVLHLSSGETVLMDTVNRELTERDGTSILVNSDGAITYEGNEALQDVEVMNRIEVPRGGEFHVTLADGSEVWLNADSELRYPARFSGESRTVYLHGEAYFSVTKDSARAFIVQVGGVDVKVYGTEFCVNTHGEGQVETVLVNGSVGMKTAGEEIVLRPGEKGTFLGEGKRIQVEAVDVLPYVSWRTGDFIFRDESLETIMDKLARWYNLEVFFRNDAAREVRLSGNLKRDKDVRELFHSFERISDVRFSVNGNTVVVSV